MSAATTGRALRSEICFSDGLGVPGHHVQVLRNHSVGKTCNVAASGPRLLTLIWIKDVLRRLLGIFHKNVEVAIFVEDARIQEFILHVIAIAAVCSSRSD